jgi:hypothetical protein
MKDLKRIGIVTLFLCSAVFFTSVAKADLWDKKTIITLNESLQIPRTTLMPGKYVLKLASSLANRHIVQVWNADETHLITTILAIPNYRLEPTGKTEFVFWETPKGMPVALKAWFYPGDNFGQEFVYSKGEFARIQAAMNPITVPAAETVSATERVVASSTPQPEVSTEQTTPAPTAGESSAVATEQSNAATTTEQGTEAERLPKTASPLPLVGLIGLLSLGAAVVVRVIYSVVS